MSDSALASAAFPAYTTKELEGFISEGRGNPQAAAISAEIDRRKARDAGDTAVMTGVERLRFLASSKV